MVQAEDRARAIPFHPLAVQAVQHVYSPRSAGAAVPLALEHSKGERVGFLHSHTTSFIQRSVGSRGTLSLIRKRPRNTDRVQAKMSGAVQRRLHENKTGTRHWALDRERMSVLSKEVVASRKFRDDAEMCFVKGQAEKVLSEKSINTLTGFSCKYSRRLLNSCQHQD